jgi:radical SAM protein with 4Fe4S-binding SPASM domain
MKMQSVVPDEERRRDAGLFPKVVLIDTISYCNLRCSMCGHRIMKREKGRMEFNLFKKIIDEIADVDKTVRVWMVFFGEALILRDKLYPMIAYAKEKGLEDVVLNSNGNLLDDKAALGLIESGLDAIYIGVDAFTPETYSILRVGGDYENTVRNIKNLIEMERRMGANKPEVFVQFVEMTENRNEKEDFVRFWTEQGAIVKIRPKVTWAGTVKPENVAEKDRYPCYWAMRTINICWDGSVALCSVDYDAKFIAGNVKNDSIQSIWLSSLREIRKIHAKGDYDKLPGFCRDCKDWQAARADYYREDNV